MQPWEALGVEPRGTTPGWHRAIGKQEVALRWREAEPPAHFLSGLRKCCMRQAAWGRACMWWWAVGEEWEGWQGEEQGDFHVSRDTDGCLTQL